MQTPKGAKAGTPQCSSKRCNAGRKGAGSTNPRFILQNYNEKSLPGPYKGGSPRKQFAGNINKLDHNILGLSHRKTVTSNKTDTFSAPQQPPLPLKSKVPYLPQLYRGVCRYPVEVQS